MRRPAFCILVCAILALPVPSRAGSDADNACGAPAEFITADGSLATACRRDRGRRAGRCPRRWFGHHGRWDKRQWRADHRQQDSAFPWQMVDALHAALPNASSAHRPWRPRHDGRGHAAAAAGRAEAAALSVGAVADRHGGGGARAATRHLLDVLHAGADMVRDAGGDLVLIDPQFSRFLRANTDLDPYEGVLQQVATMPGVALFHRFDLMRAWTNEGGDRSGAHAEGRSRQGAGHAEPMPRPGAGPVRAERRRREAVTKHLARLRERACP